MAVDSFETLTFLRGVSNRYPTDAPVVITPRRDRRPRDSQLAFHVAADRWFKRRFGIAYRSEALFLTPNLLTAQNYGYSPEHVLRVLPLGTYRYCWSEKVVDLLFLAKELERAAAKEIEARLDELAYREDGLGEASLKGHEVMLHCERCIGIPISLLPRNATPDAQRILLIS